jgi:hypothetical protein
MPAVSSPWTVTTGGSSSSLLGLPRPKAASRFRQRLWLRRSGARNGKLRLLAASGTAEIADDDLRRLDSDLEVVIL